MVAGFGDFLLGILAVDGMCPFKRAGSSSTLLFRPALFLDPQMSIGQDYTLSGIFDEEYLVQGKLSFLLGSFGREFRTAASQVEGAC